MLELVLAALAVFAALAEWWAEWRKVTSPPG